MAGPTMTLHPFIWPHIRPGTYRVEQRQTMTGGGLGSGDTLPSRTQHIEVTAPRFSLPGTEVFGVFPPPNATGAFAGRLAQIVLRSRTLPWDRAASASQPWLALVVLANGEANFLPDVPATAAYTSGRAPAGIPSDARAAALEVPQKTLTDAFPAASELDLMAHVRHVDPSETEYADSDGWVSVLISNRLPQPSTSYAAYLISLEGQIDLLPGPGRVANEFTKGGVFDDLFDLSEIELPRAQRVADLPRPPMRTTRPRRADAGPTATFRDHDLRRDAVAGSASAVRAGVSAARLVNHTVDFAALGDLVAIDPALLVTRRFPVLAHWEFSCSDEDGDFAGYMNHLEVGLLGTAPIVDPRAPVVPVAASGHVEVAHTDRRGAAGTAWYRGPFSPSTVTRDAAGRPYHVADQARRVGTDGREDLSLAAAFEVGRLLAMSDLQFLRALRQWIREEFVTRRHADVVRPYLDALGIDLRYDVGLSRRLSLDLLTPGGLGGDPMTALGNPLPMHEAELFARPDDPAVLARGFGLEEQFVAQALGVELMTEPVRPTVLDVGASSFEELQQLATRPDELAALTAELGGFVGELDAQATQIALDRAQGGGGPLIEGLTRGLP